MNILIIGEYSGFAKNLALGFRSLGHETVVFGNLDGWKKLPQAEGTILFPSPQNIKLGTLPIKRTWVFRGFINYLRFKKCINKYKSHFDVVLVVNYEFIRLNYECWYAYFSFSDIKKVLNPKGKIYLSACGDDYPYLDYVKEFRYCPPIDYKRNSYFKRRRMSIFFQTTKNIQGVIPVMYEYAVAYRAISSKYSLRICNTIPLPVDRESLHFNNTIRDKIVILHGKSRKSKGGEFIIPALQKLQEKYPDRVEILIKGGIPLTEYLSLVDSANIIVDQCWGYSYGMNAIFSMAMGKIVLSGNEKECEQEFGCKVPIVNILPDVDDIFTKLENLILQPAEKLSTLAKESYDFCNRFHRADVVASQYVKIFNS